MDGRQARPALLGAIGKTPVVRLERLAGPDRGEVWLKLESANPTGSYKDRMALAMIEGAERSGRLSPGQTVVEYTGGSTGSSLAFVCAVKGYPLRIVTSDAFAPEKLETMRAFGAELDVIPSPDGITPELIPRLMERAAEIVQDVGGYATDQFRNEDMIDGYAELGTELAQQLDGRVDAFCTYVGTAGCFLGVTRALRRTIPDLHRVVVEPSESPVDLGGPIGNPPHRGRRRRLLAAAPHTRRLRRGGRRPRGGGLRDGRPCRPGRGAALRPVDRREHRCCARAG